jgi:hypothetical protein
LSWFYSKENWEHQSSTPAVVLARMAATPGNRPSLGDSFTALCRERSPLSSHFSVTQYSPSILPRMPGLGGVGVA